MPNDNTEDGASERREEEKVQKAVDAVLEDLDQRQLREALAILSRLCPPLRSREVGMTDDFTDDRRLTTA